jgi:hypothetical protein
VSAELTPFDRGGLCHAIDWIKNDAEIAGFLSGVEFFADLHGPARRWLLKG